MTTVGKKFFVAGYKRKSYKKPPQNVKTHTVKGYYRRAPAKTK